MWPDIPPTSVEVQLPVVSVSVTQRQGRYAQKHRKFCPPAHVAADKAMMSSVCYLQSLNKISAFYEGIASSPESVDEAKQPWPPDLPPLRYISLDSLHDPFLGGGLNLTKRELSLNHIYMHDLCITTYGTASFGIAVTQLCLQYSHGGAQWTAILAEEMIRSLSGLPKTTDMVLQRSMGNRSLQIALRNHKSDFPDAILTLTKAGQVSLLEGDRKAQYAQSLAKQMLVESVGGLRQALSLVPGIEPFFLAGFPSSYVLIQDRNVLEQTTTRFLGSIDRILRQDRPGHNRAFGGHAGNNPLQVAASKEYLQLEEETICFLEPYMVSTPNSSIAMFRCRLALLMELSWSLVIFSDQLKVGTETLRIYGDFLRAIPRFPATREELGRMSTSLAATISLVRRQVLDKYMSNDERLDRDLFITQMELDGYRISEYTTDQGREDIIARLYAWCHCSREPFTVVEICDFEAVLTSNWLDRHTRRKAV